MLQVARLAPRLLGESAALVAEFVRGKLNDDGGFQDRAGKSDLYYTVFGVESLMALGRRDADLRSQISDLTTANFVAAFADGGGLDFVHLCCLARAWADMPRARAAACPREAILRRIEAFRSEDGGYAQSVGAASSVYACFLAVGAYGDLGSEAPDAERIIECVQSLRTPDGGYANQAGMKMGQTNATAAAMATTAFAADDAQAAADWLMARLHPAGGFLASPAAPIPDLLSTATSLHALAATGRELAQVRERCLDYLDSLWSSRGSFHGSWVDDALDCEYTYYGLVALGQLARK